MRLAFAILLLPAALSTQAKEDYVAYHSDSERASSATIISSEVPF